MYESEGYKNNPNLAKPNTPHYYTFEQIQELVKCRKDPIYFAKNYVKIVHVDRGLIQYTPYDFQEDIINTANNNRFVICKLPRQSGKSTTIVAYFLWYILFHENVTVAILANKAELAIELLGRLKMAYEYIPTWMQPGVIKWNEKSIHLGNGSKAFADATSASSVRGRSINIIMLDEFAHVEPHLAEDFYGSAFPTISSGKTTKVFIVSTPKGINMFCELWDKALAKTNDFVPIEVHWSQVPGRDEEWKQTQIRNTSQEQFDQEQECMFLGSSATLINGPKLRYLMTQIKDPILKLEDGFFEIHEKPIKGHTYAITADCAKGQGGDYQAFSVLDVTTIPFRQVAVYRNNMMPAILYPNVIYRAGQYYNEALVLIEVNDVGQQVADIMHYELGYDNLFKVVTKGKQGQMASPGYKKMVQYGVRTTTPVKRIGCNNLKTLVESDKLILRDGHTIRELTTFVEVKESFAAEEGTKYHDDLAMSLVLFGWLTMQRVFKEQVSNDIRINMQDEIDAELEMDVVHPGLHVNPVIDSDVIHDTKGDVWIPVTPRN
jgi:hypothetical protein